MTRPALRASYGLLAFVALMALFGGALSRAMPGSVAPCFAGARATVIAIVAVTLVSFVVGIAAAVLAALGPPMLDVVLSRSTEIAGALPSIVVVAVVASIARSSTLPALAAVLAIKRGLEAAKVGRAELLQLGAEEFVLAARAAGASEVRLLRTHFLPYLLAPTASSSVMGAAAVLGVDAAGSFLGIFPGGATWGAAIADAARRANDAALFWPGLATAATVAALLVVARALTEGTRVPRRMI